MITRDEINKLDGYFRASCYLTVAQLYLLDNPLLLRPLKKEDIKRKIVGHFGTTPGQNFIYTHLNRIIKNNNVEMIYLSGPGHGGNAMVSQTYLEGTYSKFYPEVSEDLKGLQKLCKQFSFPKGISSHVAPETPGSINEGGELGYSLAHAYGAVLDNPNLIAACVVGDGEAETGPLATSWHLNKFLNPKTDGCVLPILHLNGYKIANPTILARIGNDELIKLFEGYGYHPYIVTGNSDYEMHENMANTLDLVITEIKKIQEKSRNDGITARPIWPMIILKSKKGWNGPKEVEGSFKSHQVPFTITTDEDVKKLESWLLSYNPHELFTNEGKLIPELKELVPPAELCMGNSKYANGGELLKKLKTPNWENYGVDSNHGETQVEDMRILGSYIRDVVKDNPDNFRIFGPDEALSNRLNNVFDVTNRTFMAKQNSNDEFLSPYGRVFDSFLSEHVCEGLLEGYLLTGRHGFIHSYEAFIRIVDSMASQHAKWIKFCNDIEWRKPIASLNYILTSHCWQQDHNGFTHQDPGFLNHMVTKKSDTVRMYLPCDVNTLLSCVDHSLNTMNYINVIVASKHLRPVWLNVEEAKEHCTKGIGVFDFVSNDKGNPDVILTCCGDTPTLEVVSASKLLHKYLPNLKVRVVNVVDLMKLEGNNYHPHGLTDEDYDALFTVDKPIVFAFHGYPHLIHQLTYNRHNQNLHVRGYIEEGAITTPFDMRVLNHIDRYHLVLDVIKYLELNDKDALELKNYANKMLIKHNEYIKEYGVDMPEVTDIKQI